MSYNNNYHINTKIIITFVFSLLFHTFTFANVSHQCTIKNQETAIVYPIFGDSANYTSYGKAFAKNIQHTNLIIALKNTSSAIRPWGMIVYSSLPFLFSDDLILNNYIMLLLNIISAMVILLVLLSWIETSSSFSLEKAAYAIWISLCLVPFIPILMSDMISLMFFFIAIEYIRRIELTQLEKKQSISLEQGSNIFVSGLCFALASALKQNYLLYSLIYIVAFFFINLSYIFKKNTRKTILYLISLFTLGFSVVLIQFFYIYYQYGVFWAYDPANLATYAPANQPPFVELIAYSSPTISAFISHIDHSVSMTMFYMIKFYTGMSKLYLPIYHGEAPISISIKLLTIDVIKIYGFFTFFCISTYILYKKHKPTLQTLITSAFLIALFTAIHGHTENRYYLYPRIIYGIFIINYIFSMVRHWIALLRQHT